MRQVLIFSIILLLMIVCAIMLPIIGIISSEILWSFFWENLLYLIGGAVAISIGLSSTRKIVIASELKSVVIYTIIVFIGVFTWYQAITSNKINTYVDPTTGVYITQVRPSENIEYYSQKDKGTIVPVYMWNNANRTVLYMAEIQQKKEIHTFEVIKVPLNSKYSFIQWYRDNDIPFEKSLFTILRISKNTFLRANNKTLVVIFFFTMILLAYATGFFIGYVTSNVAIKWVLAINWIFSVLILIHIGAQGILFLIGMSIFFICFNSFLIFFISKKYKIEQEEYQ